MDCVAPFCRAGGNLTACPDGQLLARPQGGGRLRVASSSLRTPPLSPRPHLRVLRTRASGGPSSVSVQVPSASSSDNSEQGAPKYVPLRAGGEAPRAPGELTPRAPLLLKPSRPVAPAPPPTPPPTPPPIVRPASRPDGGVRGGGTSAAANGALPATKADSDTRPRFVFRPRDNRVPRSPPTDNGAARSLREILERAERMGTQNKQNRNAAGNANEAGDNLIADSNDTASDAAAAVDQSTATPVMEEGPVDEIVPAAALKGPPVRVVRPPITLNSRERPANIAPVRPSLTGPSDAPALDSAIIAAGTVLPDISEEVDELELEKQKDIGFGLRRDGEAEPFQASRRGEDQAGAKGEASSIEVGATAGTSQRRPMPTPGGLRTPSTPAPPAPSAPPVRPSPPSSASLVSSSINLPAPPLSRPQGPSVAEANVTRPREDAPDSGNESGDAVEAEAMLVKPKPARLERPVREQRSGLEAPDSSREELAGSSVRSVEEGAAEVQIPERAIGMLSKPAEAVETVNPSLERLTPGELSGDEGETLSAATEGWEEEAAPKPVMIQRKPMLAARPEVKLQAPPMLRPRPLTKPPEKPASPIEAASAVAENESEVGAKKGPVLRDVGRKAQEERPPRPAKAAAPASAAAVTAPAPAPAGDKLGKKGKKDDKRSKGRFASGDGVLEEKKMLTRRQSKNNRKAARAESAKASAPVKAEILEVGKTGMSVQELAGLLAVNDSDVVRCLFMKGIMTTVNQVLDEDTVRVVCREYDVEVIEAGSVSVDDLAKRTREFLDEEDLDKLLFRPPVVTIMGHVDHGKTSLLDYIRKSKVAAGEAGGITQGIGAYRVKVPVGDEEQLCVFLDTPGHEAFSAMRARGARVTDIAIIVVAGDDGVRPQSLEAIAHARAANVPIVVAINKMDKPGANSERVMQELATHNLMPEEWGGDVPMVPVSALTGSGVADLLANVMVQAEFQDLRANPDRDAVGTVIEASLDKARGPVATLLVQNGTLHRGDVVVCGEAYGKVRALVDDTGARAEAAGPSMAVEILGLNTVPVAGDEFCTVATMDEARMRAEECAEQLRIERLAMQAGQGKVTLASLASAVAAGQETGAIENHHLNIVLKVDAQGSMEAIREALLSLPQDTVSLRFLLQAAGEISRSDVDLAVASSAIILGFNVGSSPAVEAYADEKGVELRKYRVIYDILDDVRKAMEGMLQSVEERVSIGRAEIRAVFGSGSNRVAGCMVLEGKLVKGCAISVVHGSKEVYAGTISSLRRVKEAAKEVVAGLECGVGVDDFDDWSAGDVIEAFSVVSKTRTLEDASKTTLAALATRPDELNAIDGLAPVSMGSRR